MTDKGFGNLWNFLKSQSNQWQNQDRNTGIFNNTICTFHWNGMLVFSSPRLFISIFLTFIFPFAWISLSTYWKFSFILYVFSQFKFFVGKKRDAKRKYLFSRESGETVHQILDPMNWSPTCALSSLAQLSEVKAKAWKSSLVNSEVTVTFLIWLF